MPNKGKFIGSQDNLFVPDAPTIGAATAGNTEVSVAFTAPSDVGNDAITLYGASVFLAGATINYKVSVGTGTLSTGGSGNVYFIDGIPTKTLSLIKGFTYVFDLSDSSNSGHPFGFKNASDGAYTTGVTTSGTAGSASATVTLVLATDASEPSRYYCTSHGNGMGNTISLIEASASTDPLGAAQAGTTGSSSPITVTGLSNGTSYIAQVWAINDYGNGPLSAATSSFTPIATTVGLFAGGIGTDGSTQVNEIDTIAPETLGNSSDFGDLSLARGGMAGFSSDTRGIFAGGQSNGSPPRSDTIDYVTFASAGNATDFGNLTYGGAYRSGLSNNVRGISAGGNNASQTVVNNIDYITIASTGNATDFGNLTVARLKSNGGLASTTRGVIGGGYNDSSNTLYNTIDYITIASTANATDFGDLLSSSYTGASASNNTRGLFHEAYTGSNSNVISYITIASTGNATDFGDMLVAYSDDEGLANSTRAIFSMFAGGSSLTNINYVTIASTGNATDFGDLSAYKNAGSANCSGTEAVQNEAGFAPAAIGLFASGMKSGQSLNTEISYINIATTGNSFMFGDVTISRMQINSGGFASSTRGVFAGGATPVYNSYSNVIDYVTFSTKGKATDFGDLTIAVSGAASFSNSTRGISTGGFNSGEKNTIEYVTIASAGNATDFGDLSVATQSHSGTASTTRGIIFAGNTGGGLVNTIEYVTIASTGNATDFGDATEAKYIAYGASSSTRGVFGGGSNSAGIINNIDYITIASTGNAIDFGDLTINKNYAPAVSSGTRAVWGAGTNTSDVMDYVTIASTGNAIDFGDLLGGPTYVAGSASNSHGGIA